MDFLTLWHLAEIGLHGNRDSEAMVSQKNAAAETASVIILRVQNSYAALENSFNPFQPKECFYCHRESLLTSFPFASFIRLG